ncbi:hypothetical protein E0M25_16420 [Bacillus mycoides]|uniref:Uncharacterized protein n=2 Tax=Bacillus cereus group TaxID=86661 RepID=R8QJL6_BACCE|nr:hypothetical protein IIQ_01305 [Bacillus cereus VD118]TBX75441.1 hypothetical protein E0M25_16420 [Bacillus mycoides]CAH2465785.1 hypothetical protein ACOSJ1_EBGNOMHC_01240 [Bacillus mycoides KBAB4]SCB68143.1 Uncharacterized protein BWGO95_02275 [Bacillus mycoides]
MRAQEIPIVNRMAYPLLNSEGGHASVIVCHHLGYKSVILSLSLSLSGFPPKLMGCSPFQ